MPRQARQESGTGYYHVMLRGINREYIFKDEEQKEYYLELLKEQQESEQIAIVAWCLMDNHVHIVIKAELEAMSKAIKVIGIKYVAYYNKLNRRIGSVFADRYKSENIENEKYLLAVLRYVHKNPVKAKLVSDIEAYKWSSYNEFLAESHYIDLAQKNFVLNYFSNNKDSFVNFHQQEDCNYYLDLKEDIEKQKIEKCRDSIRKLFEEHHIETVAQLYSNKILFGEISNLLVNELGISLRQAADLLETKHTVVYRAIEYYKQAKVD